MNIKRAMWIIDKAELNESVLSSWERSFIDSLSRGLNEKSVISEKQGAVLERIAEKCT
jgi:hypothetical protein